MFSACIYMIKIRPIALARLLYGLDTSSTDRSVVRFDSESQFFRDFSHEAGEQNHENFIEQRL
jgi:hypothetical protein